MAVLLQHDSIYSRRVEQLWLILSLLSLITGFGLIVALLVLKRLAPLPLPPFIPVVFALLTIGFANFFGVYLSVLGIPRTAVVYKAIIAAAWGIPAWALFRFIQHDTSLRRDEAPDATNRAFAPAVGGIVAAATWPTVHPRGAAIEAVPPAIRVVTILAIAFGIAGLGLVVALRSLRRSKAIASRPWRAFLRGFGFAFLILVVAQTVDLAFGVVAQITVLEWRDGFAFATGYGIANIILIIAIIDGLRLTAADDASPSIPTQFIDAYGITKREREVLEGLMSGQTYRAIAESLYISPRTVETHIQTIFRKCGVNSRAKMVRLITTFSAFQESDG